MSSGDSFQPDSKPPPPAPPLPPQRYSRAAHAIARLGGAFLYGSRPSSAQGHRENANRVASVLRSEPSPQSSSSSSKNVSHKTGIPINALDISPEGTHAVLAGRDILKTIRVNDTACAEDFNIRGKLTQYASAHTAGRDNVSTQHRDQITANDVKWSRKNYNSIIAAATPSGRIVIYDLNRPSVEMARLHEHARQVHRLAFNQWHGALLLSGSQDGTIRMWDLRALQGDKSVRTLGSAKKYFGNADGVRDVKWSPSDIMEFAAATDTGSIQRWDFRKENAPILKINAHEKSCHSIDWHPHGKYLASAGADKLVKVWDFKSHDRRMRPSWHLRTPQTILHARWRRDWSAGEGGHAETPFTTQIATSYVARDPRIHVWDFNRPHVPVKEYERTDSVASDILWHTPDRLWSVGHGGTFMQTDMKTVPRPLDRQNVNVLSTAPDGSIAFFPDARLRKRTTLAEEDETLLQRPDGESNSGERLSGSHSANEGSLEDNPFSIQARRKKFAESRQGTSSSQRDSIFQEPEASQPKPQTLANTYKPSQFTAMGSILGVFDDEAFEHIAKGSKLPVSKELISDTNLPATILDDFEHNAMVAAQVKQYRLAQTWRVVSLVVRRALESRVERAKQQKATRHVSIFHHAQETPILLLRGKGGNEDRTAQQSLQPTVQDSTSNVATPLAKPVQGLQPIPFNEDSFLDSGRNKEQTKQGSSLWQAHRSRELSPPSPGELVPIEASSWVASSPRSQGPGNLAADSSSVSPFFGNGNETEEQLERRKNTLVDYRGQRRSLVRLEDPRETPTPPAIPMRVERHDSNESFQMFSQSADSDHRFMQSMSSFGGSQRSEASDQASASLGTSMRQGLANSLLSRQFSAQPDQRRPSVQPLPSSQKVPRLERTDSSGLDGISYNAQIHSPVRRPSHNLKPHILVKKGQDASNAEDTTIMPNPDKNVYLFDDLAEQSPSKKAEPWQLSELLPPLIKYHLESLNDVQFPSILALYLLPFFPNLFEPSARTAAFLRTYHTRLTSLQLHTEAAAFRLACFSALPDLPNALSFGPGKAKFWCRNCEKPKKGDRQGVCERCGQRGDQCGICNLRDPPKAVDMPLPQSTPTIALDESVDGKPRASRLWFWCQGCGHGGHTSCLRLWWSKSGSDPSRPSLRPLQYTTRRHATAPGTSRRTSTSGMAVPPITSTNATGNNVQTKSSTSVSSPDQMDLSGGACPVVGCGHDCIPGRARDKWRAAKEREKSRTRVVVRDEWVARESGAVSGVRDLVGSERRPSGRRVRMREPGPRGGEREREGGGTEGKSRF